jgi:glutaminyl-peptide cyclotransferase
MTNIIVSWHPEKARRVILCSHYDTRPIADQEPNPRNWNEPFVSANDGTSGVAFLMELGHHMKDLKTEFGWTSSSSTARSTCSRPTAGRRRQVLLRLRVLRRAVPQGQGPAEAPLRRRHPVRPVRRQGRSAEVEQFSYDAARPLVEQVWGVAKQVGAKSFKFEAGYEVMDDHLALIRAGIPTIDIIDFDYPHWHKLSDTPDKVSGEQMAEVAKVITTWLQKIK